jgi:hypothetical protein
MIPDAQQQPLRELGDFRDEIAGKILMRSRQHPLAPEPSERFTLHLLKISKKCDETKGILKTYQRGDLTTEEEDDAAELRGYRDALEWALIPDYPLTIDEHDAAIASAATLAAYKEIDEWAAALERSTTRNRSYGDMRRFIASLKRQSTTAEKQEKQ